MMLVMVFSITPKRTVHEIFGCHDKTVTPYKHSSGKETNISKDGFHCACEQQEFQTPFVNSSLPQFSPLSFSFHKPANVGLPVLFHSTTTEFQPLRGPPATA